MPPPPGRVRSLVELLYLGSSLRYLLDCGVGWRVHGDKYVLANVDAVLWAIEAYELSRCDEVARRLHGIGLDLRDRPPEHCLTKEEEKRLRDCASVLKQTLYDEVQGRLTYLISDGMPPSRALLSDMRSVVGAEVYDQLPQEACLELDTAGRAVALDLSTAGAFHLVRAVGHGVRTFHRHWTGVDGMRGGYWGALIDDLRKRPPAPPDEILEGFDTFRECFRGLSQAPEKVLDRDEVLLLLKAACLVLAQVVEHVSVEERSAGS